MAKELITRERAQELLTYDRETGAVRWQINKGAAKRGSIAGCILTQKSGYAFRMVGIDGKSYILARVVWLMETGEWPDEIDHIDQNSLNNCWCNLRNVNHCSNLRNQPLRKDNSSGIVGVYWHKVSRKWRAQIVCKGKVFHLGMFTTLSEARCARRAAEHNFEFHENHGVRKRVA